MYGLWRLDGLTSASSVFFFCQAEDGIRGRNVTGVQTCALPISAGCDYSCAWCDSKFTWDGSVKEEIVQMTALEIWKKLKAHGGDRFSHVTLSGGNPGLYKQIADVVQILQENDIEIALETQESRWQD